MERRKAIATAAAASLTLLAGAAGIALNSGIVGADGDGSVGQVSPVNTTTNPPVTIYVDEPATTTVMPVPTVQPTDGQPVGTSAASVYRGDDDRHEDDDDRHEDEADDEYEGAEDDD